MVSPDGVILMSLSGHCRGIALLPLSLVRADMAQSLPLSIL
jgi:hypothetical protein